jgi:plasmid stabilization system protein ParE
VTNSFRLTRHAERDVLDIYLYTLEHFGPAQADKYTSDLAARFSAIAAQPTLYQRPCPMTAHRTRSERCAALQHIWQMAVSISTGI